MTRRNFITTASSASLALASASVLAQTPLAPPDKQPVGIKVPPGKQKKVGFAVMGIGQLALEEILPAFGNTEHAYLSALISGHEGKAQQTADYYGVPRDHIYTYDTIDKIKDDPTIQVVYNVLPNHIHAKYTIAALRAGKDVLCEKPMTGGNLEECREMIAVAKQTGRKLMIAYRLRYEPHHWKAINLIKDGAIGRVRVVDTMNLQTTKAPNIRLSRETQGGPLLDTGIYNIQACRYLTGTEPTEVTCQEIWPAGNENFREVPEMLAWQMRMPDDVIATNVTGFGSFRSNRVRVVGDKGWIELDPAFPYRGQKLTLSRGEQTSVFQIDATDQFAVEMDHFAQCILENKQPFTPGEEGLRDMIIIDAIQRAAKTGGSVKVEALPDLPKERLTPPPATMPGLEKD